MDIHGENESLQISVPFSMDTCDTTAIDTSNITNKIMPPCQVNRNRNRAIVKRTNDRTRYEGSKIYLYKQPPSSMTDQDNKNSMQGLLRIATHVKH